LQERRGKDTLFGHPPLTKVEGWRSQRAHAL
jgi:hypothetical protein